MTKDDDTTTLPSSWKDAELSGSRHYRGKVCAACGDDVRRYPGGECRTCMNAKNRIRGQEKRNAERAAKDEARATAEAAKAAARQARIDIVGLEAVVAEEEAERLAAEQARKKAARESSKKTRAKKLAEVGTENYRRKDANQVRKRYWADPQKERDRINARHRKGTAGYRMLRLRTPWWLTDDELDELEAFERDTRVRGLEVDHFVPIDDHPDLAGIHVPWNVQALTTVQNAQRRRGCVNEFTCTPEEADDYVARGMAVWKKDIAADGVIDWEQYPRPSNVPVQLPE